jgi:putative membrane protein
MNKQLKPLWDVGAGIVRGFLMGGANVVPGVSAGTFALILGIYQRLVTAISRFDLSLLKLLRRRRWKAAAEHVDLWFLSSLSVGVAVGILALGGLMNRLLTHSQTRGMTLAAFFGMIVASAVLVARLVSLRGAAATAATAFFGLAGASFAFWFTGLSTETAEPTNPYVFVCGLVAICATILPGISGAYVLLIMGAYASLTDILKRLPHGDVNMQDALTAAVFGAGCAIGLLGFSKILRWLLSHYQPQTMALLCGFMIGALRKIWPFQHDLTPNVDELDHKVFANYWPLSLNGEVLACVAVVAAAAAFVFAVDWLTRGRAPEVTP